jgi:hypothetical protein
MTAWQRVQRVPTEGSVNSRFCSRSHCEQAISRTAAGFIGYSGSQPLLRS